MMEYLNNTRRAYEDFFASYHAVDPPPLQHAQPIGLGVRQKTMQIWILLKTG